MNIKEQIALLADKELEQANEKFPQFHSYHEAYAVLLEKVDELDSDIMDIKNTMDSIWYLTKKENNFDLFGQWLEKIQDEAMNAAYKAIQIAGMAQKFLDMEDEK